MKVRELIAQLQSVDPEATVVAPGQDHSYRDQITVEITTGLYAPDLGWTEDQGEETTSEAEYGTRLPVILVR